MNKPRPLHSNNGGGQPAAAGGESECQNIINVTTSKNSHGSVAMRPDLTSPPTAQSPTTAPCPAPPRNVHDADGPEQRGVPQRDRRGHVDDRRPPPACIARLDRRSTAASAYHSPQSTAPVSAVSTPSLGSGAHGTAPRRGSEQRPRTKPIKARRRTALNKPPPRYSQAVLQRQACKPAAPDSSTPAAHVPLQGQKSATTEGDGHGPAPDGRRPRRGPMQA